MSSTDRDENKNLFRTWRQRFRPRVSRRRLWTTFTCYTENWASRYSTLLITLACIVPSLLWGMVIRPGVDADQLALMETRMTILNIAIAFSALAILFFPDGPVERPHPALWKIAAALGFMWIVFGVAMTTMRLEEVRDTVRYLLPSFVQKPMPKTVFPTVFLRTWEEWKPVLFHSMDIFIIAHFLGYFLKQLILRDFWMVTFLSLIFEVIELSLQHIVLTFNEAWWDRLILDVLLCNAGGMLLGNIYLRLIDGDRYQWWSEPSNNDESVNQQPIVQSSDPAVCLSSSFSAPSWPKLGSLGLLFRQWSCRFALIAGISLVDLNTFLIRDMFYSTNSHPLVMLRLLSWYLVALPAARDLHDYGVDRSVPILGYFGVLGLTMLAVETWWVLRFAFQDSLFDKEWPVQSFIPIMCGIGFLALYAGVAVANALHYLITPLSSDSFISARVVMGKSLRIRRCFLIGAAVSFVGLFLLISEDIELGRDAFVAWVKRAPLLQRICGDVVVCKTPDPVIYS